MKEVNIYIKNFCEFVFKLMLFLAVFDGIRARTPIADVITIFKEISTFTLLAIVLLTYTSMAQKKVLYFSNVFLIIYLVVVGTVVILFNDVSRSVLPSLNKKDLPTPFAMHFKNIESFVIVFVLLHYEHITGRTIRKLMDYFVYLGIGYVLFTLLIYFKFDSIAFFQAPWYGRISIGYPTSDAQILSFALAYLVFGRSHFTSAIRVIFIVILIVGIVMNATATGIISIGLIFGSYLLYYIFSGKIMSVFTVKSLVYVSIFILVVFVGKQVLENLSDKMSNYGALLETKIGFVTSKLNSSIFGSNASTTDMEIDFSEKLRKTQVEKTFYFNKDFASLALGGPISLGTLIENENYFLIRSYGYVGFLLYYLWLTMLSYLGIRHLKDEYGRLLIIAIGILVVTNSAIATTYLFGVAVSFGLFVSYYYHRDKEAVFAV